MSPRAPLDPSALAHAHGLDLDPERAERLKPLLESLVDRLARLSRALPEDATPPPCAPRGEAR
jgi:hypothetical protein